MHAVRITEFGGPEVLRMEEVPVPQPGTNEVVVRVRAAGVNRLDALLREGRMLRVALPHTPGTDIAGEVAAVGDKAGRWHEGDRVLVAPILSCGSCRHCLSGEDNLCESFGTIGYTIPGGYADYVRIPARNVVAIPSGKSFAEAAAFPLTYATAANMLRKARLQMGETILVLGASGGLGLAGVQLAQAMDARVIAVVRKPEHLERTRVSADAVFLADDDLHAQVMEFTAGRGVDVAFEHVGAATFGASFACLAPNGRLVSAGATSGDEARLDLETLFLKRLEVIGCRGSGRRDLEHVMRLWTHGAIVPAVDLRLPLGKADEAHRALESGMRYGKIVLDA